MALVAKLATYHDLDDRQQARRRLWLHVPSDLGLETASVVIHDLSRGGLLLQVEAELRVGSALSIEIPEAGSVAATVVWAGESFFGCQFDVPISDAALSAALAESRVVYPDFPLPIERPPLGQPAAATPEPASVLDEGDPERGRLSISARILSVVGISIILWLLITLAVVSLN